MYVKHLALRSKDWLLLLTNNTVCFNDSTIIIIGKGKEKSSPTLSVARDLHPEAERQSGLWDLRLGAWPP